jgi:hypothetical protein
MEKVKYIQEKVIQPDSFKKDLRISSTPSYILEAKAKHIYLSSQAPTLQGGV